MKYNLDNLNPNDFESLVQSITRKIIGNGTIDFTEGTDGGREATFTGKAPYPSEAENWDGYWVFQAKFKASTKEAKDDFSWVKKQLTEELEKYGSRKVKVHKPDNYLLFTNVKLTAKPKTGGRDKANELEIEYQKKYKIRHIKIISGDDITGLINLNRDIAISFAPFILPGDILFKVFQLLDKDERKIKDTGETISRFLEIEFNEDIQSKLDHAGKLTSDKVNLEKVFIDLSISYNSIEKTHSMKFIETMIKLGNNILKDGYKGSSRFVLIAGPGYGKSTLTQFLTQIYRAYFLRDIDKCENTIAGIEPFIEDVSQVIKKKPSWIRLPIKITLKEYAGWIRDMLLKDSQGNISVIRYVKSLIEKKAGGNLNEVDIEVLMKNIPCLFIFDGLDEVPVSSNRDIVLNEINTFTDIILRRLNADAIIVSTTRPQGYSEEFAGHKYTHLDIEDMSTEECEIYLKRLLKNIIDDTSTREQKYKILSNALHDKVVSKVMKSPLQASIMAILVKSGGEPPTNKFGLFKSYFDTIFAREKQRNILPIISEQPDNIRQIHETLGLFLQTISEKRSNPSGTISNEKFKELIVAHLKRKGVEDEEIEKTSAKILEATTDRLVFISQLEDQKIGFAIRSLQEFFAAVGFVRNVNDEMVRLRLDDISRNSYWSNTMLFVVGYLTENKSYLIDHVESLCGELNGTADDLNSKSLSSISKMGSWLALNILNESIFIENPKFENKFCNLLEPLFHLPPMEKHKGIAKLPDRLIKKWLLVNIEKYLIQDNLNITLWFILAELTKNDYEQTEIIKRFLPKDKVQAFKILKIFLDRKVFTAFIIEEFLWVLSNETKLLLFDTFKEDNDDYLLLLCQKSQSVLQKGILLELIFLLSLNDFIRIDFKFGKMYKALGINIQKDHRGILNSTQIELHIDFLPEAHYNITKIRLSDYVELDQLYDLSLKYNVHLIENFGVFLREPNDESYFKLANFLSTLSNEYRLIVVDQLKYFNSALNYIFNRYYEFNILERDDVNRIINEVEQLSVESVTSDKLKLEYLKFSLSWSFSVGSGYSGLEYFAEITQPARQNEIFLRAFLRVFNWNINEISEVEEKLLANNKKIKDLYIQSISISYGPGYKFHQYEFLNSLLFFDLDEIKNIVKLVEDQYKLDLDKIQNSKPRNLAWLDEVTLKVIELLKYQMLFKLRLSYEIFFELIALKIKQLSWQLIDGMFLKQLLNYDGDQHILRVIIIFLDSEYTDQHLSLLKNSILNNSGALSDMQIQKALIYSIKNSIVNNENMDEAIKFIYSKVNFCTTSLHSEFIEYVGNYVGNKSTEIDMNNLDIL